MQQYISRYTSPIGNIVLASDGEGLTGLWFEQQKYFGSTLAGGTTECELPIFTDTKRWLDIYFGGEKPKFTPVCHLQGSPFRIAVWEILKTIPYGETVTYGEIARRIANQNEIAKMSAQAVGGAVGHNPIGIIIPCHRVIGSNGRLTGYAGGLDKKEKLLLLEKARLN